MSDLKPWTRGVFELIRHADEHLLAGSDFDKRMALVTFDNSIELSITTYLRLHPARRDGIRYRGEDINKWLDGKFHSKLAFLEEFLQKQNQPFKVAKDAILHFHDLRNALYHESATFVPQVKDLADIRTAALWVFSILFNTDAEPLLRPPPPPAQPTAKAERRRLSSLTNFLQATARLEQNARTTLMLMELYNQEVYDVSLNTLVVAFTKYAGDLPTIFRDTINRASSVRAAVLEGAPTPITTADLDGLTEALRKVDKFIADYPVSFDILPNLCERFPHWLRQDLDKVIIEMRPHSVYLVIHTKDTPDGQQEVNLGAVLSHAKYQHPEWVATDYAEHLIANVTPYEMFKHTKLFRPEVSNAIEAEFGPTKK